MTEKTLSYDSLGITLNDVFAQMGYHGFTPDAVTQAETQAVIKEVRPWLKPQFCYFVSKELQRLEALPTTELQRLEALPTTELQCLEALPTTEPQRLEALPTTLLQRLEALPTTELQRLEALPTTELQRLEALPTTQSLEASPTMQSLEASPTTVLSPGHIILRQLRGSEAYAFFVCTAGVEFEAFQQQLKQQDDLVRVFIADALGSVIAERCADQMELHLQQSIDKLGWHHTNRFSPGYCGWHVSQQQLLFPLFRGHTCGVSLIASSLMVPIKSVSGIIGIGRNVRHLDYTCGLCNLQQCIYKR